MGAGTDGPQDGAAAGAALVESLDWRRGFLHGGLFASVPMHGAMRLPASLEEGIGV